MLLTTLEDFVLARLAQLETDSIVKAVKLWVPGESMDPNDDDVTRAIESLESAVFVTLGDSSTTRHGPRTQTSEDQAIYVHCYVHNKAGHEACTRGDARRRGVYDVLQAVRIQLENVEFAPGARLLYRGHSRQGYAEGKLVWRLEYRIPLRTEHDPEATNDAYDTLLSRIQPTSNPLAEVLVERTL